MRYIQYIMFCIALLYFGGTAGAAVYYVDQNHSQASDNNSGSESAPWRTIQKAVDTARAGDVVNVKAGTYYETVDLKNSGSSGSPITFRNHADDTVVLDGSNSTDIIVLNWGVNNGKNYIVWDGIDVRNGSRYGMWVEGDYNVVQNCKIYDNGTPGGVAHTGLQALRTKYLKVLRNEVYNNGWNGIAVDVSDNAVIEYNYVHDNLHHNGINMMPTNTHPQVLHYGNHVRYNVSIRNGSGIYMRWQAGNEISNNVIADSVNQGIYITVHPTLGDRTYRTDTKIYNNTIVGSTYNGIRNESGTHLTIMNNIFAYNGTNDIYTGSTVTEGHQIDHNLYFNTIRWQWGSTSCTSVSAWQAASGQGSHSLTGDPRFTNRSAEDYSLSLDSAAIDRGADFSSENILFDIIGNARPQGSGYDIGAHEYPSGGGQTSLIAPENLRIIN